MGLRNDAPDAAEVQWLVQSALFDVAAQVSREGLAMLQNTAIQIHDVESTFRSVVEIHGTETLVG